MNSFGSGEILKYKYIQQNILGIPLVGTLCLPFVCVYHAHTSRASDISLSYGAQLSPVPVESSSNEILSGDGQLQQDMAVAKLKSQQIPKLKTPEDTPTPEG